MLASKSLVLDGTEAGAETASFRVAAPMNAGIYLGEEEYPVIILHSFFTAFTARSMQPLSHSPLFLPSLELSLPSLFLFPSPLQPCERRRARSIIIARHRANHFSYVINRNFLTKRGSHQCVRYLESIDDRERVRGKRGAKLLDRTRQRPPGER